MERWSQSRWHAERQAVESVWGPWFEVQRQRRLRLEKHPVFDFLFEYYRTNRRKVEPWHPPVGVVLEGVVAGEFDWVPGWVEESPAGSGRLDPSQMSPKERERLLWISGLLEATLSRPARFNCFGLHEWAMVYRSDDVRHQAPLRLDSDFIAAFLESRIVCCSHFDAYRFFTPAARPLNTSQPRQDGRYEQEQHGCIHYNMDLYKWCYKAFPWLDSRLVAEAFGLAYDARILDMRASPYDLSAYGFDPVFIEKPEGAFDYQKQQQALAVRGSGLAARMAAALRAVLAVAQ